MSVLSSKVKLDSAHSFCVVLASNDFIGTVTFAGLYAGYYFYCFNVANLGFKQSLQKERVQSACLDGVYRELRNVFENTYPGVNVQNLSINDFVTAQDIWNEFN